MTAQRNRRSKFMRALVRVAILILAVLTLEAGLRVFLGNRTFGLRVYRSIDGPRRYALSPGATCEMMQAGRSLHITVDADGHRTTPGTPADPRLPTLHLVGDSQVFGQGLSDDETLSYHLQKLFGGGLRVINYGVPGYGPNAYHKILRSLPSEDWVVVVHTEYNDLRDFYSEETPAVARCGYLVPDTRTGNGLPCWLLNARLFQLTSLLAGAARGDHKPLPLNFDPHSTAAARLQIYRLSRLYREEAEARGARLVFALIPWDAALAPSRLAMYSPDLRRPTRTVQVPDDCDIEGRFRRAGSVESLYLPADEHLSPEGAAAAAEAIAEKLRERGVALEKRVDEGRDGRDDSRQRDQQR
jgi:hypothetical protein